MVYKKRNARSDGVPIAAGIILMEYKIQGMGQK